MTLCVLSATLIVLGGNEVGQAVARRAARPVCGSSDVHNVVARNLEAEVYRIHPDESEEYEYRGCAYGSRRLVPLGTGLVSCDPYACFGVSHITLDGTTVAFETFNSVSPLGVNESAESENLEKIESRIVVVDLRRGRVLHKTPTGQISPPRHGTVGAGEADVIVVKSDGAVAWINDTNQNTNTYEVHALDRTGGRVLAVGSNIAPSSLALAGSTLYWTQGGKPFSTALE